MLLSQLIFSSTLLLFIVLIHILYCIVLYYSDLEPFCGFYAIQNKLSNIENINSCHDVELMIIRLGNIYRIDTCMCHVQTILL